MPLPVVDDFFLSIFLFDLTPVKDSGNLGKKSI